MNKGIVSVILLFFGAMISEAGFIKIGLLISLLATGLALVEVFTKEDQKIGNKI